MKPQFVLEEKMALDNGVKYGRPFCQYKQKVLPLNFTQIGTAQKFWVEIFEKMSRKWVELSKNGKFTTWMGGKCGKRSCWCILACIPSNKEGVINFYECRRRLCQGWDCPGNFSIVTHRPDRFYFEQKERNVSFFGKMAIICQINQVIILNISIVLNINSYINNNWNSNEEAPKVVVNSRLTESKTSVANAVQAVNLTELKKEVLER